MPRRIRSSTRRHLESIRHDPRRLFAGTLDPGLGRQALAREGAHWHDGGIYTPCLTLGTFFGQVLCPDHSCRAAVEDRWLFKGRRVQLVDGTTVSMPDTRRNQAAFPQNPARKPGLGFLIARLVAVISLATGAVRDLAIGPYLGKETGETALFRALWDRLDAGDIILGGRDFASFFGIAPLLGRGIDGVFRMYQRRKVDFRRGRRLGVLDHVVTWTKPACPSWLDRAIDETLPAQIRIRELRIKVAEPGSRVEELVLVTTTLDPAEFTKEEVAELYARRWQVELNS